MRGYARSTAAGGGDIAAGERIAIGLVLALLLGLYVWAAHYRLDPLDEGYFIYTSSRVLAGDLPYRDFSTPYTPGFFYLNAALFKLFGLDVVTLRLSLVVARLAVLSLVYLLGRRLMPTPFAVLPVVVLLAEDQVPGVWENHPAWWATLMLLAAVWCVCRYRQGGRLKWWLAAGLAAGVGFAFKQNIGIFTLAALSGVALTDGHLLPPICSPAWLTRLAAALPAGLVARAARLAGPGFLLALGLGALYVMRPHLDLLLFAQFSAPFLALGIERLRAEGSDLGEPVAARHTEWLTTATSRLVLLGVTFGLVTLPWLLALMVALGAGEVPLAAFLGGIDTSGYFLEMDTLRPELVPLLGLLALAPFLVWVAFRRWPGGLRAGIGLGGLALAAGFVQELLRSGPEVHPRPFRATVLLSIKATTNLILYLPLAAFWGVFGLLAGRRLPTEHLFTLRWYLLAGCLLLLNQYPRMDETHLLFSGPLLWIIGSYGLWRAFLYATRCLAGRAGHFGRPAMFLALLGLPLAAVWPTLETRRSDLFYRQPGALLRLTTATYVPLDLPGARVNELDTIAWKYRRIAAFFEAESKPGEHIFVYPAAPLLYYLVDRPNASRFNHILPGLLSPADEQETIQRLGSAPAAWVLWDSFGADYWGKPGVYTKLTDYIWDQYEPVESIGGLEVMRRKS